MSSDAPSGPPAGLAVMRALQQRLAALEHEQTHLLELIGSLKSLVGDAFAEGFRVRLPDQEEPYLIDWLQSQSKAQLAELFSPPDRHDHH